MNNRRYFGRQDVKERTMKKSLAALDPDIASRYEDLDDEDNSTHRYRGGGSRARSGLGGRITHQLLPKKTINIIQGHITNKRDVSLMRTVGGGSKQRDLIYMITVKNASRSGKDHILKLLSEAVDSFLPISPRMDESGDLSFFVLSEDDAAAVAVMSKRITDKHNPSIKYVIYKNRRPAPYDPLSNASRQMIEQILRTRYNKFTNSLDLSSFQNDQLFEKSQEPPRGLFHNNVMVAVAESVAKNFSSIRGIRLNNNNLRALDFVSTLVYAAPNIVELDLSNNAISRIEELRKLSGWMLESVHFENNEFAMLFHDNLVAYTNAVHEHFPLVSYLDGVRVNISMNAATSSSVSVQIPKFKPGHSPDETLQKMIENFLIEYFSFYDGPNGEQTRQQLMNAYDSNATFSYSISILPDAQYVDRGNPEIFQTYQRNSHNIMVQQKWQSFRDRLIYRGPMDIAVALSKLPPTEHVKQSFLLDFNLISNNIVVVTLQGIFRDGKENIGAETRSAKFKFFLRQFSIIPKAEGLAIISDLLQITPISTQRMEHYNNLLKNSIGQMVQREWDGMAPPPPSPQIQAQELSMSTASTSAILIKPEPSTSLQNEQTLRAEMVKQFSHFTGMKPDWAEKCLQDCSWNWDDAQRAFGNIRDKIPSQAFS